MIFKKCIPCLYRRMQEEYNFCCFCGEDCSPNSQACKPCIRGNRNRYNWMRLNCKDTTCIDLDNILNCTMVQRKLIVCPKEGRIQMFAYYNKNDLKDDYKKIRNNLRQQCIYV